MSDIGTAFARIFSQTVYKKTTAGSFIISTVMWIYLRNICIPLVCYNCWVYLEYPTELAQYNIAPTMLTALLTVLCAMHVYWVILFIKMIISGLKSGDTDNKQSRRLPKESEQAVKVE